MTVITTYPLDVRQFIVETLRLPLGAKAGYLMILLDYCANGKPPPDDDRVLASIVGDNDEWTKYAFLLRGFFDIHDGYWYHTALEAEMERQAKVQANAATASKSAKAKRDQGKGFAQIVREALDGPVLMTPLGPITAADLADPAPEKREVHLVHPPAPKPVPALRAPHNSGERLPSSDAAVAGAGAEPADHPIPDDFFLDGSMLIAIQNLGATMDEIAQWLDYFKPYHTEAGTLMTDWGAGFIRYCEKKIADRDKPAKAKPRIEVSRRAPAPPNA